MLKHGLLFVVMAFLSSDTAFIPQPELQELSATIGEESVQILGRLQFDKRDCSRSIRTQAALWADSVQKSPIGSRPRLGLGVGLQEKADDLWGRGCLENALKLYEKAAQLYGEVIQLSAGDPSNTGRTFRLQSRMNLVEIYIRIREFGAAREILLATLAERDAYLPAIVRLAEVELRSGGPQEALDATNRLAGKQWQEDIGGLSVGRFFAIRAEAHCALGMADEANREIKIARRNDPNVVEAQCRVTKRGD